MCRRRKPWPADSSVPSMQRSAVEVALDTRSGPLRVTTTHLEYYSAKLRAAQVEALRELQIEAAGHAHAPTIGIHDKEQWPGPPFACDFIFVTEDLAHRVEDVVVNGATDASDHQPVMLELRD